MLGESQRARLFTEGLNTTFTISLACELMRLRELVGSEGQAALEYLMLLVASIIIVAIVLTFMGQAVDPPRDAGSKQTWDYLCVYLDTNSLECGCYQCDANKRGYNPVTGAENVIPTKAVCDDLSVYKKEPLLSGTTRCPSLTQP